MKKIGSQTIKFDNPITILDTACIVGPKEADGPLAKYFDKCLEDEFWGEKTWEKAESKIIKETVNLSIIKSKIPVDQIDYCFAGDLLNQCISSSFGLRDLNIPFFGIFGACNYF
jgi:stage V sporulation protein AD